LDGGPKIGCEYPNQELVYPAGVPPPVLVGLAQAQFPIPEDSFPEPVVMDLDVVLLVTADSDSCASKQFLTLFSEADHVSPGAA
jgi:hypothetical protein